MKIVILILTSLVSIQLHGQSINLTLKHTLDTMLMLDQAPRALMDPNITPEKKAGYLKILGVTEEDFFKNPWGIMIKNDAINLKKITGIIDTYGYPGKSLVGEPTNKAAWYIIQHSDQISDYLPLIKEAGKNKEIPMTLVAMMNDRHLMHKGQKQVYGTQIYGGNVTDKKTGETSTKYIVWPIKNTKKVNQKRKAIGYTQTIESYALQLDVVYEKYTLRQVKRMFDNFN